MKVLVTGATGRLGRYVVPMLLERKHDLRLCVRNVAKMPAEFNNTKVETVVLDLLEAQDEDFDRITRDMDAIVHLAVLFRTESQKVFALNVEVTKKLVLAAKKNGVKKFIFLSTTSVYRTQGIEKITEKQKPDATDDYGKSKILAERFLRNSGVPFVILRPALIYGVGFDEGFRSISKFLKRGLMPVIGNGNNLIAMVHAQDVAEAIGLALEKKEAINQDFNLSGASLSERDLLKALAEELGVKPPRFSIPANIASTLANLNVIQRIVFGKRLLHPDYVRTFTENREIDCSKAKELLDWKAHINARGGIRDVLASMKAESKRNLASH